MPPPVFTLLQQPEIDGVAVPWAGSGIGRHPRLGFTGAAETAFFEVRPAYGPCDVYRQDNLFFDASGAPLAAEPAYRDRASKLVPYCPADGMRDVVASGIRPPTAFY